MGILVVVAVLKVRNVRQRPPRRRHRRHRLPGAPQGSGRPRGRHIFDRAGTLRKVMVGRLDLPESSDAYSPIDALSAEPRRTEDAEKSKSKVNDSCRLLEGRWSISNRGR